MKKIYLFPLLILFAFSCTNLDEEISDSIPDDKFPENEAQGALVTVPTYKELSDLIDDAGWWYLVQETTSDELVFPVRDTDWEDGGKWKVLHEHTWDNNTDGINSMWSHMYEGVSEANRAIDQLKSSEDDPEVQIVLAKLKTLRAFYYWLLIDNYGDVPYVTSFFDADTQPFKEDRAVIHAAIIEDLEEIVELLPENALKFAVSKGMAYSLLAKLYLNAEVYTGQAQWAKADEACQKVIDLGFYALEGDPLLPFINNNESSIETIFSIPFDEENLQGFRIHMRSLHYLSNQTFDMVVGPWNGCAVVKAHFDTYTDDDVRKEYFLYGPQYTSSGVVIYDETVEEDLFLNPEIPALVMDNSFSAEEIKNSGARIKKFEIAKGAQENLSNDFPVFRYADILLMKAEAMIRQGQNGDAFVNQIRARAGVEDMNNVTLDDLLAERGREMFCEGHRRMDLIRFNAFGNSWWEKEPSTSDRTIFPIPQWAIDTNPNLGL